MNDTHDTGRELTSVKIANKYAKANGCDNCWGDLHQGCTAECTASMKKWGQCIGDIELYAKQTVTRELEKLPTLIARIKDQENTPEYLVVDAREITNAIARLNGEHDQQYTHQQNQQQHQHTQHQPND